uniref:Zinc finger protein 862-like n=1 Tax=Saccoglossus kowalevskii TaxID=10224 RepID=A0ABM0LZ42_SACKO|nr:PREDICTED: zinc finger protein 862-like [Saccoglossus kowalevskii]
MERFLVGYHVPASKKPKTAIDDKEKRRQYDSEVRVRGFQTEWKDKYPWLSFFMMNGKGKMFCDVCRKFKATGTYVTGCTNFKLDSIKSHSISASHTRNFARFEAMRAPPGHTVAEKSLLSMNKQVVSKLVILFKTAHGLAKRSRPYTDFSWMCDLDEAKGLVIGDTYRNDKRCKEFIEAIANTERINTSSLIENTKFLSIISDGATDSSHREAEICFVKSSHLGVVSTKFIGIANIAKADANGISQALTRLLCNIAGDTWKEKVIGMGTDGASVMLGRKGGVIRKIQDQLERPYIVGVHCSAHRLELAYKDACKEIILYKKVDNLMMNLYYFYRNSSLNRSNLIVSFEVLGKKPLMPTRVSGTRWVPHTMRAISNIANEYSAIVTHLQQIQNPHDPASRKDSAAKAKNFLMMLTSKNALYFIYFLWDITICLSRLSLVFQDRKTTVGVIHSELSAARDILQSYKESDGPKLREVLGRDTFNNQKLSGNAQSFTSARNKLIDKLIASLSKRFEVDEAIIKATAIADLKVWPASVQDEPDFGATSIEVLSQQFGPALLQHANGLTSTDDLQPEWIRFKHLLYARFVDLSEVTWAQVNSALVDKCPNILALIDLVLSMPASSFEAERGFSLMKIIKTDWRSRLKDSTLSDLMMVKLESPEIGKFSPNAAINLWFNKNRRPFFNDKKMGNSAVEIDTEDDVMTEETGVKFPISSAKINEDDDDYLYDSGAEDDFYSDEDETLENRRNHEVNAYHNLLESISDVM